MSKHHSHINDSYNTEHSYNTYVHDNSYESHNYDSAFTHTEQYGFANVNVSPAINVSDNHILDDFHVL
ncbi:MAG TPA: hypothetical protein VIY28_11135 [Pseudonocardiaceae bacterium]